MSKRWDLKSTHSLESCVEWLRKQADAQVVLVLRGEDGALAVDPTIDVVDVHDRIRIDAPKLLGALRRMRDEQAAVANRKQAAALRKGTRL